MKFNKINAQLLELGFVSNERCKELLRKDTSDRAKEHKQRELIAHNLLHAPRAIA